MGRGRKKNKPHARVCNAVTTNEGEDIRAFVSRIGGLPSRVWLPPFDIGAEIESFAKAHGYTTKNVSALFDRHNANGADVCDAFWIVNQRAESNPNTMHYIVTSGTNIEAVSRLFPTLQSSVILFKIVPLSFNFSYNFGAMPWIPLIFP